MLEQYERLGNQIVKPVLIGAGKAKNALLYLPSNFESSPEKQYPLLITHPGSGEVTIANNKAGLPNLIKNGIPKMIADGWKPEAVNPLTGELTQFIVLSVQQDSTGYIIPPDGLIYAAENEALINTRYLKDQVFVTGLSLGGCATLAFISEEYYSKFASKVCALVPLSGKGLSGYTFSQEHLKKVNIPIWALCGDADPKIGILPFFKLIAGNVPRIATTLYKGGHDGWVNQYKNARMNGLNILEWCLAQTVPVQQVKVISSTASKIVVEGPALSKTVLLKLGNVDLQYNVL